MISPILLLMILMRKIEESQPSKKECFKNTGQTCTAASRALSDIVGGALLLRNRSTFLLLGGAALLLRYLDIF